MKSLCFLRNHGNHRACLCNYFVNYFMSPIDAAHRLGLEYPGGITALAVRLGMTPAVLSQKLNPNCHSHHLNVMEALRIQVACNKPDITRSMANELGFCLMPLSTSLTTCEGAPKNLAAEVAHTCKEFGDFMGSVQESIADGKVTPNERKSMEKELHEMINASQQLLRQMQNNK